MMRYKKMVQNHITQWNRDEIESNLSVLGIHEIAHTKHNFIKSFETSLLICLYASTNFPLGPAWIQTWSRDWPLRERERYQVGAHFKALEKGVLEEPLNSRYWYSQVGFNLISVQVCIMNDFFKTALTFFNKTGNGFWQFYNVAMAVVVTIMTVYSTIRSFQKHSIICPTLTTKDTAWRCHNFSIYFQIAWYSRDFLSDIKTVQG